MANKLYDENSVKAVADAIRAKNGSTEQYKLADMPQAIENIQTISEGNCWDYIQNFKISPFIEPMDVLEVNLSKYVTDLGYAFAGSWANRPKFKTIIVNKVNNAEHPITAANNFLSLNDVVEELYMNFDTSHITNFGYFCNYYTNSLKAIYGVFDLSSVTANLGYVFSGGKLETITFKQGTIHFSISFFQSDKLSDESIQSIIDGLAQVETAQTITFTATVKAKLTEEQIAAINEKGWTLA